MTDSVTDRVRLAASLNRLGTESAFEDLARANTLSQQAEWWLMGGDQGSRFGTILGFWRWRRLQNALLMVLINLSGQDWA